MLADSSASAHLCRAYLARPIASASRHHLLLSHQHHQQQQQPAAVSTQDGDDSARNSIGLTSARNNGQTLDTTGLVSTEQQVDVLLETIAFRIPVQLDSVQFVCCEQAVTVLAHCYIFLLIRHYILQVTEQRNWQQSSYGLRG